MVRVRGVVVLEAEMSFGACPHPEEGLARMGVKKRRAPSKVERFILKFLVCRDRCDCLKLSFDLLQVEDLFQAEEMTVT